MNNILEQKFEVKWYEVDFDNRLKISSIFNYMQEIASNHANQTGVGYEDLINDGLFWVLSRAKIKIHKSPSWGDIVKVETWAKKINRFFAVRDFELTDDKGGLIANATTVWFVLNVNTMRPQGLLSLPSHIYLNEKKHGLDETLDKIKIDDASFECIGERRAVYSDIDYNRHVNNARYIEWIMDCFSPEQLKSKHIKSLQVNFLNQTKLNDKVQLNMAKDNEPDDIYYVEGMNKKTKTKVFQSIIEWTTDIN